MENTKNPKAVEGYAQNAVQEVGEIAARIKEELKLRMQEAIRTNRFNLIGTTPGDRKQMLPNILFALTQSDPEFRKVVDSFPRSSILLEEAITELLDNK